MSFPLFRRPGAVVFLDDDPAYLDMLAVILPPRWPVSLFVRPQACLQHLQPEAERWEADAWTQQQIIERWRDGAALIPQILRYWTDHEQRQALTRVCVVDYAMPGMNGLQVLQALADWPGARVLLTGQADEQRAVDAFNQGLIDQYIPKQAPDIARRLVDAVQQLLDRPHPRQVQIWHATLSPAQQTLLRRPAVQDELSRLMRGHWVEHVVLGDPFGVLGMDAQGQLSWLQLEPATGLAELAELAAAQGLGETALADLRAGRSLAGLELHQALGAGAPALAPAFELGPGSGLLGALFNVDPAPLGAVPAGHAAWLARQGPRTVHD